MIARFESAANAWARASVRERRLVVAAAIVVACGIGWTWIWQPMKSDTARLARDLPRQQSVLAAARAQADSIAALERSPSPLRAADPMAAVERVLAERGLRPGATLDTQEGRVRLTFASLRFDAVPGLVDALSRTAGVRVADAVLTRRVEPALVRAEFTLVR